MGVELGDVGDGPLWAELICMVSIVCDISSVGLGWQPSRQGTQESCLACRGRSKQKRQSSLQMVCGWGFPWFVLAGQVAWLGFNKTGQCPLAISE